MSDSSLIGDLAGLSKPLTKLIDTVRDAVGTLYEPRRIRLKAQAEAAAAIVEARTQATVVSINACGKADALLIAANAERHALLVKAKTDEELRKLQIRAAERVKKLEYRRQENIESIVQKAANELPSSVSAEPVQEDWVVNFFEHCKDIKDEEMQALWARLLAGEIGQPGSFSPRALALVKLLRKTDAALFTRFCTCVWHQPGQSAVRFVPITLAAIKQPVGAELVSEMELFHLKSLGLIEFNHLAGFNFGGGGVVVLGYGHVLHRITFPEGHKTMQIGQSVLTDVGQELVSIAGATVNELYRQSVLAELRRVGHVVDEI